MREIRELNFDEFEVTPDTDMDFTLDKSIGHLWQKKFNLPAQQQTLKLILCFKVENGKTYCKPKVQYKDLEQQGGAAS